MNRILRSLGLGDASPEERRATWWTALMFAAALTSTSVLRPLREQFGVDQGVERLPYLYTLTLVVTAVFAPAFWALATRWPSRRFVPAMLHAGVGAMVLLYVGLRLVGTYDWRSADARFVGEAFWGGYSAFNVAVPALVWIHAVEHFRRDQALRLFGLLTVGGTAGAVLGATLAKQLSGSGLAPDSAALAAAVLLEVMFGCYLLSHRACARMVLAAGPLPAATAVGAAPARGPTGLLAGLGAVLGDAQLRAIAGYMLLLGMVGTAFHVAQTALVGEQVATARDQHGWLANQDMLGQSLVLVLQVFCTGRLQTRLPAALFLCLLPLLSTAGLLALWAWPTVAAIAVVQILRRGAQFAFEKPAREVLYTPLPLWTKHRVKFVLDTFAFRLGDLMGAYCHVYMLRFGRGGIVAAALALAACWAVLGVVLGRRSDAQAGHRAVDPS